MTIRILYFARAREVAETGEETLDWRGKDINALCEHLSKRGEKWRALLSPSGNIKFAVNQKFAGRDAPLDDAREVAIFPPVTGG